MNHKAEFAANVANISRRASVMIHRIDNFQWFLLQYTTIVINTLYQQQATDFSISELLEEIVYVDQLLQLLLCFDKPCEYLVLSALSLCSLYLNDEFRVAPIRPLSSTRSRGDFTCPAKGPF